MYYRFVLLICLITCGLYGQSQNSFSVLAGGEFPFGQFADEDVFEGGGNAGKGFSVQVELARRFTPESGFGVKLGYYRLSQKEMISNRNFSVAFIPLGFSYTHYIRPGARAVPFISAGLGANFVRITRDQQDEDITASKALVGFNAAAGTDIELSKTAALVLFLQWNLILTNSERFEFGEGFFDLEPAFNATFFSLGVGYKFSFGAK